MYDYHTEAAKMKDMSNKRSKSHRKSIHKPIKLDNVHLHNASNLSIMSGKSFENNTFQKSSRDRSRMKVNILNDSSHRSDISKKITMSLRRMIALKNITPRRKTVFKTKNQSVIEDTPRILHSSMYEPSMNFKLD